MDKIVSQIKMKSNSDIHGLDVVEGATGPEGDIEDKNNDAEPNMGDIEPQGGSGDGDSAEVSNNTGFVAGADDAGENTDENSDEEIIDGDGGFEHSFVENTPDEQKPRLIDPHLEHPDSCVIDITLIDIEPDVEDVGVFGISSYIFAKLNDPGLDAAFNATTIAPTFDEIGAQRYNFVSKALGVIPISRFIKALSTTEADLSYYGLNPRGMRGLSEALFRNETVDRVDLEDNWLSRDGSYHVGEMLKESMHITVLNLTGCRIGPEGALKMQEGIGVTQSLVELNLSWNNLGDEGIAALAPGLESNYSIKRLILCHNKLGSSTGEILGHVMQMNQTINHLDLSWNNMYPVEGLKSLFTGLLQNTSLMSLNLSWNALMSRDTAKVIKQYIMDSDSIQHIDLSHNLLEGIPIRIIRMGILESKTLLSVHLGYNPILPFEANTLLSVLLKPESKLQKLSLENIWVDKEFKKTLMKIKKVSKCEVVYAGVYSDFKIKGADFKQLLFARAKYEAQKPKAKKKKKDFGHFVLAFDEITQPLMLKDDFLEKVKKDKIKLDGNLVLEIMNNFEGAKKRVDIVAMKSYYTKLYPNEKLPEVKPKKAKKGKKKQKTAK